MGPLHFVFSFVGNSFAHLLCIFYDLSYGFLYELILQTVCSWFFFFCTCLMSPPMLSALAYLRRMPCPHHIQEKGHHTVVSS